MNSKESTNYNYILGTYQKIKIQEKFVKLQEMWEIKILALRFLFKMRRQV